MSEGPYFLINSFFKSILRIRIPQIFVDVFFAIIFELLIFEIQSIADDSCGSSLEIERVTFHVLCAAHDLLVYNNARGCYYIRGKLTYKNVYSSIDNSCEPELVLNSAFLDVQQLLSDHRSNWTSLQFLVYVNFVVFALVLDVFHGAHDDCSAGRK